LETAIAKMMENRALRRPSLGFSGPRIADERERRFEIWIAMMEVNFVSLCYGLRTGRGGGS